MSFFLPRNYSTPKVNSSYMKFQDGENRFRILSRPILGWEDWTPEMKPVRTRYSDPKPKPINQSKEVKHFWAMIVWNYSDQKIQILQVTQSTIRDSLVELINDKDWGDPCSYDLKVMKSGKDKQTKYNVNPLPHKPVSEEIRKAFRETPVDLEMLFEGLNPFECHPSQATRGIFENRSNPSNFEFLDETPQDIPTGTFDELKEHLEVDGTPTANLEKWVKMRAVAKGESTEKVITSCLEKETLPKFKKSFMRWLENLQQEEVLMA